ncbi:hypothetical protein Salat_2800200 [Sesamum alatum]|uniref:Uncharacterized protein n=1 Tax=Sesamum alatum TaxID=300844 RepID=A0AAE1XLC7_9LAMI|nr:hypothetical protein Salat_2800200 [Sesamum alatum]
MTVEAQPVAALQLLAPAPTQNQQAVARPPNGGTWNLATKSGVASVTQDHAQASDGEGSDSDTMSSLDTTSESGEMSFKGQPETAPRWKRNFAPASRRQTKTLSGIFYVFEPLSKEIQVDAVAEHGCRGSLLGLTTATIWRLVLGISWRKKLRLVWRRRR